MLFVDPRTNARLAGAQLSFFASGTITPIPAYQDAGLTQPWAQPILADSKGNFPPNVYLDPFTAVKVKVQVANSAGVVQQTTDPYFVPLVVTEDSLNLQYANGIYSVKVPTPPTSVPGLTISNIPGSVAIRIVSGVVAISHGLVPAWAVNNLTTGFQTATLTPIANKPGIVSSTPTRWLPILSGGVTYYAPCFL